MAIEELDDLLNTFAEADRPAMRAAIERNQPAMDRLTTQKTVYDAFIGGDADALARATAAKPAVSSPAIDLDALNRDIDTRMGKIFDDPRFATAVETRAKTLAEAAVAAARQNIIGAGAEIADQIYQIRSTHKAEFGVELDRAKFDPFFTENAAKYGHNLKLAYDAFVNEDRINKRVEAARAEGAAHRATTEVPGGSQPGVGTPLRGFMDKNPMNNGGAAARGDAIDAAANAFRTLREQRVN